MANVLQRLFGDKKTPAWAQGIIDAVVHNRSPSLELNGYNKDGKLTTIPDVIFKMRWLESLNVFHNRLTAVPPEIGQLQNLRNLNLGSNQLTAVSPEIGQLQNMTSLDLSYNKLTTIPPEIGQLKNLQSLSLNVNQLTAVPSEIGQLKSLQSLNLSGNKLTVIPQKIRQLQNLKTLNLYGNELTDVSLEIGQLKNLQNLNLSVNQLTTIPPQIAQLQNLLMLDLNRNQLTAVPPWLVELFQLKRLYLGGNPITEPPQELLGLGYTDNPSTKWFDEKYGRVNINMLRAYFRQLAEEGNDLLYEAKLIIIGEAGAGKTTLVKKLQNPACPVNPAEPSTEGIDVAEWGFPLPQTSDFFKKSDVSTTNNFRVNIWDFGGQEIYHATHKFFLTRRSLYALVADAREQKTDFYYWLNVVELLSDNSPALIIANEKQNRAWPFNETQLRGEFQSLKEVLSVNLADSDNRRLYQIIEAIKYHIVRLPHIGQTLPKTWTRVRAALETDPRNTMPLDEYLDLCNQYGFKQYEDKLQLSDYLHDLGVCLHFQDDPLLNKTFILKPEWGTTAVYVVLDNDRVKTNQGRFSRADLATIWREEQYARWRDELLQLMLRFQLCYQLPGGGDYIAPQLLGENQPKYDWNETDNLYLRYRYPAFMPKGILTRFIVATHRMIANQEWVWKTGVILKDADAHAEVIEHYQRREITVRASGGQKRDLLTKISYEFEKIHADFPDRLHIERLVPCNCSECAGSANPHFFDFDKLKRRLAKNITRPVECQKSYEMVDVWGLIDNVGARQQVTTGGREGFYVGGDYIHVEGNISDVRGMGLGRGASGTSGGEKT